MTMQCLSNDRDDYFRHLEDCLRKFNYLLESPLLTTTKRHQIIFEGRKLAKYCLNLYNNSSDTKLLIKILNIYEIISHLYPNVIDEEARSKDVLTLIEDKCKYFVHLLLVLFHLNDTGRAKNELIAFRIHLKEFERHIRSGYKELYNSIKELYQSFAYISIYDEQKVNVNIYIRVGFQNYELYNFSVDSGKKLNRAVIIGSCSTQASLTGKTIDMFRISHAIEMKMDINSNIKNARKFMFYNTHFWDMEIGINDAVHNMSRNGILLIYVSGDAYEKKDKILKNENLLFKFGIKMKQDADGDVEHLKIECLFPGDVVTFLIVPTVLIIDSECSQSFKELYKHTDEPFMCLLSPTVYPMFIELSNNGKLFTLFLTSPQTAFCWVCHNQRLDSRCWDELLEYLNNFMLLLLNLFEKWSKKLSFSKQVAFMDDTFSRAFLLRYMFCVMTLRLHCEFINEDYYPSSNLTSQESEVMGNKQLQSYVYKMASIVGGSEYFVNPNDLSFGNESIDVEK